MASALASQLQALARVRQPALPAAVKKGKPSLLFDFKKAADVDLQTIFDIASQGLDELSRAEPRFRPYRESLFSRTSLDINPELQTAEFLSKLDESIHAFCCLVSNHFLSPPAFKVLEYLIRRYKANERNVDALMTAALPYHSTNEFVRLVQVLAIGAPGSLWGWLSKMQTSGASLPRDLLAQRCANDRSLLLFICKAASQLGGASSSAAALRPHSRTFLSFYAVLVCEVLAVLPAVGEDWVAALLPYILEGLGKGALQDYRAATLMILAELCSRTTLGRDFVKVTLNTMLKHTEPVPEHIRSALLVMAHLAVTQDHIRVLSDKTLKYLSELPNVFPELASVAQRGNLRLGPLLLLISRSLAASLVSSGGAASGGTGRRCEADLLALAHAGALSGEPARAVAGVLLEAGGAPQAEDALRTSCRRILRVLDQRHPETTDAAVNAYLEPLRKRQAASDADAEASGKGKKSKVKGKKKAARVDDGSGSDGDEDDDVAESADALSARLAPEDRARFDFVRSTFASGGYAAPCGGTMMTLAAALTAPQAAVRRMALQQLDADLAAAPAAATDGAEAAAADAAAGASSDVSEARTALTAAALERLRDDDLGVVVAALGLSCLKALPPAALLDALQPLVQRLGEYLYGSARLPQLKAARKAACKAVALLQFAGSAAASSEEPPSSSSAAAAPGRGEHLQDSAVLQLTSLMLPRLRDPRVAVAAARAAAQLSSASLLFSGLSAVVPQLEAHLKAADAENKAGAQSKKGKGKAAAADAGAGGEGNRKARKKAGYKAAAASVERELVSTLSKTLAADPSARVPEVMRLVAASAAAGAGGGAVEAACRRSQHLMLLAMHAAAASASAGSTGDKPSGAAMALLRAAVDLAEALLPYTRLKDAAAGVKSWPTVSTELISPEDGLPMPAHPAALQADPAGSHAAVILASLQFSLKHLPEAVDATASPAAATRALGLLASLGCPWDHLRDVPVLVTTRSVQGTARNGFLSALYAVPLPEAGGAPAALQCLALHVQGQLAAAAAACGGSAVDVGPVLVTLLAALGSCDASVRSAACECVASVAEALQSSASASASAGHLSAKTAAALCKALLEQRRALCRDAEACRVMVRNALHHHGKAPSAPAVSSAAKHPTSASKAGKAAKAVAAAAAPPGEVADGGCFDLEAADAAELMSYLTSYLHTLDNTDASGVATASTILACLEPKGAAADVRPEVFAAGCAYLSRVIAKLQAEPACAAAPYAVVVQQTVALFTPASVAAASASGQEDNLSRLAEGIELLPPPPQAGRPAIPTGAVEALAAARLAVVRRVTSDLFAALPPKGRTVRELFAVLLGRYEGDSDEAVRTAARAALEAIPLSAELLVPLLEAPKVVAAAAAAVSTPAAPPSKKSRKSTGAAKSASQEPAAAAAAPAAVDPAALRDAVAALELLQWRTGISSAHILVPACQALLRRLLPILGSIASTLPLESDAAGGADAVEDAAAEEAGAGGKSSLAGYAATLTLQALTSLAAQLVSPAGPEDGMNVDDELGGGAAGGSDRRALLASFDLALAVQTAREAPDAAVRNGALALLAALATRTPEAALTHVLQVLAVVNESAALQDDEYSRTVGATALAAIVPAWIAAGQPASALWEQVASSLPTLAAHRRLEVLLALMRALPKVDEVLSDGLLVLLRHAVQPYTAPSEPAATGDPPSQWYPELASQLALQVELPVRLACCARLMELALGSSAQQPQMALPRTVVAFVTAQLKKKVAVMAATAVYRRPDPDPSLEAACRRLMEAALAQMQLLQQPDAAAAAPSASTTTAATTGRRNPRAFLAASRGLYNLFAALQGVMAADTYLQSLLALAEHPADKVKRRAIKLFTDKVRGVRSDIEDELELPQRVRDAKLRQAGEAAARACAMMPPLLLSASSADGDAGASPLTRQLALVALAAIAAEFGEQQREALLAAVPAVLSVTKDSHASIRASALATVAAFVRALGAHLVPVLPSTVAAAVAAADSAWARLAKAGAPSVGAADEDAKETAAAADGAGSQEEGGDDDDQEADDDGDDSDEDDGAAGRGRRRGVRGDREDAALELSSALACLNALVETLGGFLSPHLPSVLAILLNPRVLACRVAGCDQFAASIRGRLPTAVPPRLLLPALYDRLQPCIELAADAADAETAAAPTVALLQMVAAAAASLEPKLAAQYHEHLFAFLLRALDVRQRRSAALAAHGDAALDAVEAAAIRALVALVMKLSEARFKPMFLRMLEWASTLSVPEGAKDASYLGRMVALFGAVNALADRLRSVMVPYYRYLLEACVQHLGGEDADGGKARGKKKQRRVGAAVPEVPEAAVDADVQARLAWLLRLRIIRALHRCFLHDTVGFIDAERFARLQPILVSQLDAQPPDVAVPYLLSAQHKDPELAGYVTLGPATRPYTAPDGAASGGPNGAAAVGCLLAMAVAANNDALWKPLNHATLMLTRSSSPRTRALALELVAQLVERLREEYLVLLPESLPFMSELLEDTDAAVAKRVREVIAQLEEISGEKLDDYLKV